jgi:DNA-binding CsgD family transcriptional regulator
MASADGEPGALRWLDAEDDLLGAALAWALDYDLDAALRLGVALAPWWWARGRLAEAYGYLSAAVRLLPRDMTVVARAVLGDLAAVCGDLVGSADHYTAAIEAGGGRAPAVADALVGRAFMRLKLGDIVTAAEDAHRGLALSRSIGSQAGEAWALAAVSLAACCADDPRQGLEWARQAEEILTRDIPGHVARRCRAMLAVILSEAGEPDSARRLCADGLAQLRDAADLTGSALLLEEEARAQVLLGNLGDAAALLRQAMATASRIGAHLALADCISQCLHPGTTTERWVAAVTFWSAVTANWTRRGLPGVSYRDGHPFGFLRQAEQVLTPTQLRAAMERGAGMTLDDAVELISVLTDETKCVRQSIPRGGRELSAREREVVTLVARGHTNAQIAAELFISVRTVISHLDRIRGKTGYRRRADLTRLARTEGLV